jgi:4-oxalocrotonate tautomerase
MSTFEQGGQNDLHIILLRINENSQDKTPGANMPYVNIRVAGTLSKEQKQKISKGVTEVISKEANKPPEAILIFIDEVPHENIAKAGNLLEPPK